jgi:monovalent cation:proton antiporter-2 (CPA2) family protein
MTLLLETTLFLAAAVVAVPLFRWIGLGAILGYLVAGLIIGPHGTGLIQDSKEILHFAEFGIVLLLFLIGLELQPKRLWELRGPVFGYGSLQLLLSGLGLFPIGLALGLSWPLALLVGLILGLSSTAFALQLLAERQQLATPSGQTAFAILLFQDLAFVPLLAFIPLMTADPGADPLSWVAILQVLGTIAGVVIAGHFLVPAFLRLVAGSHVHEAFTAAALLVVLGTGLLMEAVGLSMSLGAFLAGVLLADTIYRHELEATIEPFKGLLMGLFFIAVGMSVDITLILSEWVTVVAIVVALVGVKLVVIGLMGWLMRWPLGTTLPLAAVLSQGGEFDFVLLGAAVTVGVLTGSVADLLIAAVTVSMALTPFLFMAAQRLARRWEARPPDADAIDPAAGQVLIAGFGRFAQIIARILRAQGIPFTALEPNFQQVEFVRRYGNKVYFGDASKLEVLRAAGADQARLIILAMDDPEASLRALDLCRRYFPRLKVYARARNRHHAYQLLDHGADFVIRETFVSSLEMAQEVLEGLGFPGSTATEAVRRFREFDEEQVLKNYSLHHNEEALIESAKEAADELEELFGEKRRDGRR